jgi:hypothetical protein
MMIEAVAIPDVVLRPLKAQDDAQKRPLSR